MARQGRKLSVRDGQDEAVALLAKVAAGEVALADPRVRRILDQAVADGVIDASVLEYMDIVFALVQLRKRCPC
jgi:hypothetical protein